VVASGVIGCMLYVMISSIFLLLICYDLIKSDTRNKQVTMNTTTSSCLYYTHTHTHILFH